MKFPITINHQYHQYTTPEDFKKIINSRDESGNLIRISDFAKVTIYKKSNGSFFEVNGQPSVANRYPNLKQQMEHLLKICEKAFQKE